MLKTKTEKVFNVDLIKEFKFISIETERGLIFSGRIKGVYEKMITFKDRGFLWELKLDNFRLVQDTLTSRNQEKYKAKNIRVIDKELDKKLYWECKS